MDAHRKTPAEAEEKRRTGERAHLTPRHQAMRWAMPDAVGLILRMTAGFQEERKLHQFDETRP